ncbi:transposase [Bacillus cereus]|uniref:transposase n=1 Tax=Bacillus cereus TaxID=1396 RepID=UPI0039B6EB9A
MNNLLLYIQGIGTNTDISLLAEIGDITRFENNQQLNAFAGINISRFQLTLYCHQVKKLVVPQK